MAVKIEKNFDLFQKRLQEQMRASLKEIGQFGAAEAQSRAPVDTGELRRSISYVDEDTQVHIGSPQDYAGYVEEGTSKQKAQPYIKPAIYENTKAISDIVEKNMREVGD